MVVGRVLAEPAELVEDLHQLPAHRRDLAPGALERGLRGERLAFLTTRLGRGFLQGLEPRLLVVDHAEQERPGRTRRLRRRPDLAPGERLDEEVLGPPRRLPGGGEILLAGGHALVVERIAGPEDGVDQRVDRGIPGVAAEQPDELVPLGGRDLAPRPDPVAEELPLAAEPAPALLHGLELGDDRRGTPPRIVHPAGPRLERLHQRPEPGRVLRRGLLRLRSRSGPARRPGQEGRFRLLGLLDLPGERGGRRQQLPLAIAAAEARVLEELRGPPLEPLRVLPVRPRQRRALRPLPRPEPVAPGPGPARLRPRSGGQPRIPPPRLVLGRGRHRRVPPRRGSSGCDERAASRSSYPNTVPKSSPSVSPSRKNHGNRRGPILQSSPLGRRGRTRPGKKKTPGGSVPPGVSPAQGRADRSSILEVRISLRDVGALVDFVLRVGDGLARALGRGRGSRELACPGFAARIARSILKG